MPGRAWLYALSAVLLWSTVASIFKLTLRHVDFVHLLLISSWTAFLALALVLAAQGKAPSCVDSPAVNSSIRLASGP